MRFFSIFFLFALVLTSNLFADISYSGGSYSQNFDGLASTGTNNSWSNDTTVTGWHLYRRTSATDVTPVAVTNIDAGNGSTNTGKFFSFGTTSASDRALGGVGSSNAANWGSAPTGGVAGWIAVGIQNDTGLAIDTFTISFDGEQWRDGGSATPTAQQMVLEYGFGSSFAAISTWTAPGGNFDWSSPVFTAPAAGAAVNGNVNGLVAGRGGTISGLNWLNGDKLFIRWIERNDAGNDHGLAIDNFQFSATAVPEPTAVGFLALSGIVGMTLRRRRG